jgi:hypothetical protein
MANKNQSLQISNLQTMKKYFLSIAALGLLISFSFTSCKKDSTAETQPVVPPAETMQLVDFSSIDQVTLKSHVNAVFARNILSYWNAVLSKDLALPILVFSKALNQTPTKVSPGNWSWQYSHTVASVTYQVTLLGTVLADTAVSWNLSVNNVTYVTGQCKLDRSSGTWTLNRYNGTAVVPTLKEAWTYNATSKTGSVKYLAVESGARYAGSYLSLSKTTDPTYNANFEAYLYDSSTNPATISQVLINWNTTDKSGEIKNKADKDWRRWDAGFNDI